MQFKTIKGNGCDVDRNDFFQINTYMSYYQNHPDKYNVRIGGLLYPIEENAKNLKFSHSETWFGNSQTKFIVDGIDLSGSLESVDDIKFAEISKREQTFIENIKKLLK